MVVRVFLLKNWLALLAVLSVEFLMGEINTFSPGYRTTVFSASAVAMLATVVGIFLVFRFNNAYQRWWEARILWGQMVNASRNFGRQVTLLLSNAGGDDPRDEATLAELRRRLLYRQIAFVNAVRQRLRGQDEMDELAPFVPAEEQAALAAVQNRPLWLLQRNLAELRGESRGDTAQQILLTHIDTTVNLLGDVQGGCERINNTAFPDLVRVMSKVFVWAIALLIPTVFLEPDQVIFPLEFVAVLFIAMAFITVDQLAVSLMYPFDNSPNDTPMSALCVNIERDLRQQLGETELPAPLEPVDGVLM
jgi:putative membrane protein